MDQTTTPVTPTYSPITLNLYPYFNEDAFSYDTNRSNGSYDGYGNTYSADLASSSILLDNIPYIFGPFQNGVNNSIKCSGQTIAIDNRNCNLIQIAGSATSGNYSGVFRVNYTDGSYADIGLTMKDWCTSDLTGMKVLQYMNHRHTASADEVKNVNILAYAIPTDTNKYVKSIVLPNQNNVHILAITLLSSGAPQVPVEIGNGLRGEYFDNIDLTDSALVRTDSSVNFDWGTGSPGNVIGPNTFSVRWTGFVMPEYSETYTFYTVSDDGVRLWVNNTLIIDRWTEQAATEYSGSIALVAGQKYSIKLEYFEKQDKASVKLFWSSPNRSKQIIPQARLFN